MDDLKGLRSVLAVVAHPDDMEFGFGGTVARFTEAGAVVHLCLTTNGASGSKDPAFTRETLAATRREEQEKAAASLGVESVTWLGYEDGYLEPTIQVRREITRLIRRLRPELLITHDPSRWYVADSYINHPDHRATGDATLAAFIPSSDTPLTFPELLDEGLEPFKPTAVWLGGPSEPDHYVDITSTIDRKIEALRFHVSQIGTDFSGDVVRERNRGAGEQAGVEYAEAFNTFWFGPRP